MQKKTEEMEMVLIEYQAMQRRIADLMKRVGDGSGGNMVSKTWLLTQLEGIIKPIPD